MHNRYALSGNRDAQTVESKMARQRDPDI